MLMLKHFSIKKFLFQFLFCQAFLITGCISKNTPKPEVIKAMANYLDANHLVPSKKSIILNCLLEDRAHPQSIPTNIKYAGYYVGSVTSPASTSLSGWNSTLDEIAGQGNIVVISYMSQEMLIPSIDPDELIIKKITAAKAHGFKVIIEIPLIFFDFNLNNRRIEVNSLSPDYRHNWNHFKKLISPYLDTIVALYPFDEPYWNAYNQGVAASEMKQFLDEIGITIKADLPRMPLVFIEAHPMVNSELQIPAGFDWIGMDCYGSFDHCGLAGSEHSIPEYYKILRSKLLDHQNLAVVPEAFLFSENPTDAEVTELLIRAKKFLNWVATEARIIALVPFIYRNLAEEKITGAREMCSVREFYRTYLKQRTETSTENNSTLTISCPVSLVEGGSGTCSAKIIGKLISGYWTVDGTKVAQSDNLTSFTWNNIPVGTFKVQGVAKDNRGNTIISNIVSVTVSKKEKLIISCPTAIVEGSSGKCITKINGTLVSGYWNVDGVKVAQSDNHTSYTWHNVPAGIYRIQVIGKDISGNTVSSNVVTVRVKKIKSN